MDWKNIISKDEDTEVLDVDEGLVSKIKNEILPPLKEMIQVLGIPEELSTLHMILDSAEGTLSNIQGKTDEEVNDMARSGYYGFVQNNDYLFEPRGRNVDDIIIEGLIEYEELRPNSIERIANALDRNKEMAKKFINLASAMQIKVEWRRSEFRLSVGNYYNDVHISAIFD